MSRLWFKKLSKNFKVWTFTMFYKDGRTRNVLAFTRSKSVPFGVVHKVEIVQDSGNRFYGNEARYDKGTPVSTALKEIMNYETGGNCDRIDHLREVKI